MTIRSAPVTRVRGDASSETVTRIAAILDLFAASHEPLRQIEVARALDLPKSTTHGLLSSLVTVGLLERDITGRYEVSVKLLAVANAAVRGSNLNQTAHPLMNGLSTKLRTTVNLGLLNGTNVVYVEKVQDRTRPIQLSTSVGGSLPAHATAMGVVLVSGLPEQQRDNWLDRQDYSPLTPLTARDRPALEAKIEFVRKFGFALEQGESHLGITCIAAPVKDFSGETVAALSVTDSDDRIAELGMETVGRLVRETADRISLGLGAADVSAG